MSDAAPRHPQRILIVKLSSLGDLFHALPAVHNLKVALRAEIDWVTQPEYVELVRCFSDVSRVLAFPRRGFLSSSRAFLKTLRATEYDYIIDLQGLLKSALVALLARGRARIGPSFSREGARLFYSATAGRRDKKRHAVDENLDVVRHLGLALCDPQFPVNLAPVAPPGNPPRIALVPVSRWPAKNWPAEHFAAAARRLQQRTNASIFLVGGPGDLEACRRIESALTGNVFNFAGKHTLVETAALLKTMDLLIANDSGPVHMAVAVGTPALVLFGPTDPTRTGPYGKPHRVLSSPVPCQPCFASLCKRGDAVCMTGIQVDEVVRTAVGMLKAPR